MFIRNKIVLLVFLGCPGLSSSASSHSIIGNNTTGDTANILSYRISGGGFILSPSYSDPIPGVEGYTFDFLQNDTRMFSWMHNSQGFIIRNQIRYNIKETALTPCIDISYGLGNFNMIQYNEIGEQISHSWFRKISLATMGAGFDFCGKYVHAGFMYRSGYCTGGYNKDPIPYEPQIVKNQKLNLTTNFYHGFDISLGGQYKNFSLTWRRGFPLADPIPLNMGIFAGLASMSIEIGYEIPLN